MLNQTSPAVSMNFCTCLGEYSLVDKTKNVKYLLYPITHLLHVDTGCTVRMPYDVSIC